MFIRYIKLSVLGLILSQSNSYGADIWSRKLPLTVDLFNNHKKLNTVIRVVDEFGKPIQGAQIFTKDNILLGATNEEGEWSANSVQKEIIIKYLGYFVKELRIEDQNKISLVPSIIHEEDQIRVVHDNKETQKLVGALSVVFNNQIKNVPTPLYLNALTGRMAGLYTQEISGFRSSRQNAITSFDLAGSLPTKETRYSTSLSDNSELLFNLRGQSPVTLIDGVQREIYSIDPESIESIVLAKDALSSILLGQRSSRGVLQVFTKRGKIGAPRINFTAQSGFQQVLNLPEPLAAHEYAYLYNEALLNSGRQPVFSQEDFEAFRNGINPLIYPNVNWYDATIRNNNPITRYNLGVNGGVKNARYSMNLSYLNQLGMFKSSEEFAYNTNLQNQRILINSAVDVDVTDELTIGLQFLGRIEDGRQPGAGTNTILRDLYNTPNNAYPIFNPDDTYGGSSVYRTNLYQQVTGSGYLLDNNRDLLTNLDFNYKFDKFLKGLYAKGKVNVSSTSSSIIDRNRVQPVYDVVYNDQNELVYTRFGNIADQPNSFETTSTANFFYFQGALGYNTDINGDHQIGSQIFVDRQTSNFQFDLPAIYTNYAAKVDYAYQSKYFAELAMNYSGFNRFLPGKRYGLFYAVGLGWDILKENFLAKQSDWISQFKLRATYGRTGNTNEGALGYYSWRAS